MSDQNGAAATGEKTYSQKDIEAERAHAQHFKAQLEEVQNKYKGIDPDDYSKTKAELAEIRKKAALGNPEEMEKWKATTEAEIRKQVQKDLDAANSKAEALSKQNKELTVTDRVFAAAAPNVMPDMSEFIKDQIRRHGDLNEKGEIVFKDASGKEMYAPGSTTQLMNTQQFVEHLKNTFPSSFKASEKSGAKQGGERTSVSSPTKPTSMAELQALPRSQRQAVLSTMSEAEIKALSNNN